jgi:serine/threonine protein kinase
MAKVPSDSESVGLSTVPRRRIVVGGDPKVGSSNPPAEQPPRQAASSEPPREKRSSAPAHLKSRRDKLAGTGYSEVPDRGEERVSPAAIPRAPRVPQIEGEKAERIRAGIEPGGRTAVGMLGAGRRATEEGSGADGAGSAGSRAPFRRSDTARSMANPVLAELGLVEGASGQSGELASVQRGFEEVGPPTDANFPPAYSPSGTLQSMSAVRPDLSSLPSQLKFSTTLTGAAYVSPQAREQLLQSERDSERPGATPPAIKQDAVPQESARFQSERTMVGLPRSHEPDSPSVRPLRPSPPPVVLSDRGAESLLVAIAAAARGQLHESEMPVPSERLEADVLQQLGKLDEALKSAPRMPTFDREPDDWEPPNRERMHRERVTRERTGADDAGTESDVNRVESSPHSSIDAPSPGSVPSQSALPGEGPLAGPGALPTVGRYEVLARLKSGGMGSVYMCRLSGNAGFRRLFAMKVLHAHLNRDAEALESFQREARVLGCVHHPNIVGVVDFGSAREPYIVLEYVEGGSLHELFRATTGGRDPRLLLTIILDVLEGLSAAHSALDEQGSLLGLVHCDVCPQNILVGVDGMARVTDFGIAQTEESRLHPEQLRGKPRYLAPERATNDAVDARADLFSLGVVLYAGLTGVEPFVGETAEETRWNVSNKAIPTPSTVGFRPPPSLDWLCLKALARDPAGRFQSAEEMAVQLRRIGEREGLLAPRSEVSEWVRMTLSPSLAARRVASRRGTVTGGGRLSNTPPGVQPVDANGLPQPMKSSLPPPSSAEHTAPLSSEAGDFADNTEILAGERGRRMSRRVVYGAVAVCLGIFLWGLLAPDSMAKIFSMPAKAGVPEAGEEAAPPTDPSGAIVPELGSSFEERGSEPEEPEESEGPEGPEP